MVPIDCSIAYFWPRVFSADASLLVEVQQSMAWLSRAQSIQASGVYPAKHGAKLQDLVDMSGSKYTGMV